MAASPADAYIRRVTDPPYLAGQILLSMPGMADPRFERAVIAMCMHDADGAFGLVVNHVHGGLTVRRLMEQLNIDPGPTPDVPVYAGGPVEPNRGFVLHTLDYGGEATLQVADAWGLTATLDVLKAIAAGDGPRKWLFALGYAGWNGGQLEAELTSHGWFTLNADANFPFDAPYEQRWPRAFAMLGVDVKQLSPTTGRA